MTNGLQHNWKPAQNYGVKCKDKRTLTWSLGFIQLQKHKELMRQILMITCK